MDRFDWCVLGAAVCILAACAAALVFALSKCQTADCKSSVANAFAIGFAVGTIAAKPNK